MSTAFRNDTPQTELVSDQFAPETFPAKRRSPAQTEQPSATSLQSTFGNAALANAEPEPARLASEATQLQSSYGNAVVSRMAEPKKPSPQETRQGIQPSLAPIPTGPEPKTTPPTSRSEAAPAPPETTRPSEPTPGEPAQPEIRTSGGAPVIPAKSPAKEPAKEEKKESKAKAEEPAETEPGAGAGAEKGAAAEPKPVEIAPGDPSEMLSSLGAAAPSQAVLGLQALRGTSAKEFTRQQNELAENPPAMPRPSGLPRKTKPEEAAEPVAGEEEKPEEVEPGSEEQTQIEMVTPPVKEPLPVPSWLANALDRAPEESRDFEDVARASLDSVPTSDDSINLSAGPRPTVDLTGEADPKQMSDQLGENRVTLDANLIAAQEEAARDYGENDIYPVVPEELLSSDIKARAARRTKGTAKNPKGIPAEGFAAFDQAAAEQWSAAITQAQTDNSAAADERTAGEQRAHAKAAKEIAALEAGAIGEQTNAQLQAQIEVSTARKGWADELSAADGAYTKEATSLETQARKDIDREKTAADEGARRELEDAEAKAQEEKRIADEKAAKKKKEAKKESGGFFGWLKSKAKAAINAIRDAVNFIFDQLRKAVKWLIDKAKKLAMWLIEKARQAIVGLIRTFGKALELAANVFLAAFPKARDKAIGFIRKGVAVAEDAVNYAADKLKAGVAAALDALGAALDFVLELYQKAYNAIIDAIEFIVIGLIEILEGIARLAESASMVGDYFLGQVQEEGLGIDLTQPLPIEKVVKPGDTSTAADTAVETGALSPADAGVLKKESLDNSDAEMSHVAELVLEPELLASIPPLAEGEEFHFGQNDKPENERDAILSDTAAAYAPGVGITPTTPGIEGGNGAAPAAATPDVANMTPDQQLAYLENQETPHTCDAKKEEEPAKDNAVPEHMRIYGPFTSSQRFSYMWGQIKKGISQWWSCNKVKVIVAFAIGALVALLLTVLTGGAILAAIPPLLTIIAAILVGVAIIKAAAYVGDFIKLAWSGDLQGGAKALARAFAILVIELVFALLFSLGSIIKILKSGLKATAKAAAGAAKTAFKSTVKAGRELATTTKAAFKAGVTNSKLVIQGFKNGFGEGIKTLGDLTKQLLAKSRFRGFFFRMRAGFIELWGRFNPEVLLGKKKITKEDAEKGLKDIAKAGEGLPATTRAEAENLAKAVGKAVEEGTGELPKTLRKRIRKFFEQFRSQHVEENPILAEVWERALKRIAEGNSKYAQYFEKGVLKPNLPDDVMKQLYAKARGEMNTALKSVVEELETGFKTTLKNRITELPERVQVHHLLYKSIFPELAVTKSNLILALRKVGGSLDELHDLFHLISAGGVGNRWRTLQSQIIDLIKEVYKL